MSGLAVTESGSCERIMFVGEKELVVKQWWALHARHGLQLYTSLVNKVKGRVGKEYISNSQAPETSLSEMARQKAEEVVQGKLDAYLRTCARNGVTPATRSRGANQSMTCPVLAAIAASRSGTDAGRMTSASSSKPAAEPAAAPEPPPGSDWRDTAEPFVAAMKPMTKEQLLACLAEEGVPVARELQQEREGSQHMQAASRAALKDSARFARTTEGRKTWQTLLSAHACDGGGGASTVPDFRKAEILGVHPSQFSAAWQRARSLQPTLSPAAALDQNAYWYQLPVVGNDSGAGGSGGGHGARRENGKGVC